MGGQTVTTTLEHPFYVDEKGWTPARDLEHGDLIVGMDDSAGGPTDLVGWGAERQDETTLRFLALIDFQQPK